MDRYCTGQDLNHSFQSVVLIYELDVYSSIIIIVATAYALVATMLSFWWIESILQGLPETFGSRSIFLAHDNAGCKFDKHLVSIDFSGYKKTNKFTV